MPIDGNDSGGSCDNVDGEAMGSENDDVVAVRWIRVIDMAPARVAVVIMRLQTYKTKYLSFLITIKIAGYDSW